MYTTKNQTILTWADLNAVIPIIPVILAIPVIPVILIIPVIQVVPVILILSVIQGRT
jgi:hypothetical protein